IIYTESQNGNIVRYDNVTVQPNRFRPTDPRAVNLPNTGLPRTAPWHHTPAPTFPGPNHVFPIPDRGDSWETISPDLTRALDRNALPMRGTVPADGALGRHEGTAVPSNLATLDESPLRAGLLAAGSDDGVISITRDGGRSWHRVERFPTVPETTYVSRVVWSA